MRLFEISRTIEISPREYESEKVIVSASNMYNAFHRFRMTAGLPEATSTEIGDSGNPCIRFIMYRDKKQQRYYVTLYKEKKEENGTS
tara:strand:- start:357 stop:617 length:261 start_codon:yes stop_codon:yes gene_type:complete